MINTENKVVTVEALSTLHEHNKKTYTPISNPTCSGTMMMDGDANFSGSVTTTYLMVGSNIKLVPTSDSLQIVFLDEEVIEES